MIDLRVKFRRHINFVWLYCAKVSTLRHKALLDFFALLYPRPSSLVIFLGFLFISSDLFAQSLFGASNFSVHVDGEPALEKLLAAEIDRQRGSNLYLKELTSPTRIARYEAQLLTERLYAEGFYDAEVSFELIDEQRVYSVISGDVYRIGDVIYDLPENITIPPETIDIKKENIVRAQQILAAERRLNSYVSNHYCLYEIDTDYDVILESQTQTALVTFKVFDSPSAVFGDISFSGLESIETGFLMNLLPMRTGNCFKRAQVDTARLKLIQSNLLLGVSANIGAPLDGKVDVQLNVKERPHRTLSAGIGFETDNGLGVSGGWEHRNLLGRAEKLQIDAIVAERFQNLSGDFTLSQFLRDDQTMTFYADLARENTDAFDSRSLDAGTELTRNFGNHLRASLGGGIEFSRVEENEETDDFALLSIPVGLEYDRRNDPLNPTRGWVAALRTSPYWDGYETSTQFLRSSIAGSLYHTFESSRLSPTLAMRAATGSIGGEDRDTIPANIRFYSGGGGSVRGYPFQTLGPLDENDDPSGGLSFTEVSFESRFKFNETWGAVLFLDGGYSYEKSTPTIDDELLWGAGIGVRFYTSFAPIRLDVAVPLDRRDDIDDSFQLYIGIGQAF